MSFIFSRVLVEEFLQERRSAGVVSVQWKTIHTVSAFSCSDKTIKSWSRFLSGTTFEHFSGLHGEVLLTWFREVSLAKACQLQGKARALKIPDRDYGERWRGLLVKFNQDSCSWKTAHSLFQEEVPESSLILPRWGMMRCGELWERITSVLPTKETGSGSWRTPTASDGRGGAYADMEKLRKRQQAHHTERLADQVKNAPRMWPTPTKHGNHNKKGSSPQSGDGLSTAVKTWPTPRASDGRRSHAGKTDSTSMRVKSGRGTGDSVRPGDPWNPEPILGRVADGVAHRLHRVEAIGDGQVPAVAASIWRILSQEFKACSGTGKEEEI